MKERNFAPVPDSPEWLDWIYRDDPEIDRSDRAYFRNGYVDRTTGYRGHEDGREWGY